MSAPTLVRARPLLRARHRDEKRLRRVALLNAAARLFSERDLDALTMADVARATGLAKGTVYLYFPSKEELLLAVHERNIDGFFGASSIERFATEVGIEEQARRFRSLTLPRPRGGRAGSPSPAIGQQRGTARARRGQ